MLTKNDTSIKGPKEKPIENTHWKSSTVYLRTRTLNDQHQGYILATLLDINTKEDTVLFVCFCVFLPKPEARLSGWVGVL